MWWVDEAVYVGPSGDGRKLHAVWHLTTESRGDGLGKGPYLSGSGSSQKRKLILCSHQLFCTYFNLSFPFLQVPGAVQTGQSVCEVYSGQPEKWERPNVQTKKQPSPWSRCSLAGASLPSAFMDLFLCNSAIWFGFVWGSLYIWQLSKANTVRAPWQNKNIWLINFYYWNSFNPWSAHSVHNPRTGL